MEEAINGLTKGLSKMAEQLKKFNVKQNYDDTITIHYDNQYEYISMSSEEQDKIIFNLLQDRYRWIKEDPRTMGEDEVKYKEQIKYLYNLYKNKIK